MKQNIGTMKFLILTLLCLAVFIPIQFASADTISEEGSDYIIYDLDQTTRKFISKTPEVFDGVQWKNYIFEDNQNYLRFDSMKVSMDFFKDSCSFKLYDVNTNPTQNRIIAIDSVSHTLSKDGINIIDPTCEISNLIQTLESVSFDVMISDGITKLVTKYELNYDSKLEYTFEPENLDTKNSIITITDSCFKCIPNKIDGDNIYFGNYIYNTKNNFIDPKTGINLGHQTLTEQKQMGDDFSFKYETILRPNQKAIIDPTFTSADPSEDAQLIDTDNDNNCEASPASIGFTNVYMQVGRLGSVSTDDCDRSYVEYDISSIPDGSTITDTDFTIHIDAIYGTPNTCTYVGMSGQPTVETDATNWANIGSGTVLVSGDTLCQSTGTNKNIDLGSAGDTYVDGKLGVNWVAIGIKSGVEGALDASYHITSICPEESACTPDPTLTVVYTVNNIIIPKFLENDGTVVTSGDIIQKNSTLTRTIAVNSTGQAKFTGLTGNQNFTYKETVNNFVVNKTYNYNAVAYSLFDAKSRIFDTNCADSGNGNDFELIVNETDGHRISAFSTPICSPSNVITTTITWTANGQNSNWYTSLFKIRSLNTTHFGDALSFKINGTTVGTTRAGNVITSDLFSIGNGLTTRTSLPLIITLKYIPDPPTALATPTISTSQINLSWTAPINTGNGTISGYKIWRETPTGNGFTVLVADTGTTATTYPNTGLSAGTQYNYKIAAYNEVGISNGNTTAVSNYTITNAPTSLIHSLQTTSSMRTTWTAPSPTGGLTGYKIERETPTGGGFAIIVANTGNATLHYDNTGLSAGTQYNIRISAINSGGTSAASTAVSNYTITNAPTSLIATAISTSRIDLSWTAPSGTVTGYKIERESPIGGGFSTIVADTGNTATTYSDTGLLSTTQYNYRVSAINQGGTSAVSNQANATTGTPLTATLAMVTNKTGDTAELSSSVTLTAGSPAPITVSNIQILRNGTSINNTALSLVITPSQTINLGRTFSGQLDSDFLYNFTGIVRITNNTGIPFTFNSSAKLIQPIYTANYFTSSEGNYQINYTHSRTNSYNILNLVINRQNLPSNTECNFRDQLFESGNWINVSNSGWYNQTLSVTPTQNVYITCYNDQLLFGGISYGGSNSTLAFVDFMNQLGTFAGVPVPFLFILLMAGLFTGRSAITGIIFVAITIGVMGTMGFLPDINGDPAIGGVTWALIVFLTGIGIFVGKKYF